MLVSQRWWWRFIFWAYCSGLECRITGSINGDGPAVTSQSEKLFKVISKKASNHIKNRTSIKICYEQLLAERAREALFLWMTKHVSQQTHTITCFSFLCYLLVSPISYSLSLSSSKMSTSSLPVMERLLLLLMLSLASVIARRSPLLHSIGSSRMAAEENGKGHCVVRLRENPPK